MPSQLYNTQHMLQSDNIHLYLFCVFQGGIYQFQLLDYYGANGACIMFGCIVQCVAVSWAFGEWSQRHALVTLKLTIYVSTLKTHSFCT